MWSDRLAWSGETPLDYPGLNPVAATRFDDGDLVGGTWADVVDPANTWTATPWAGSGNGIVPGRTGDQLGLNRANPATEKGQLVLPFFEGLWPSSGRLLMGLWVSQNYTMAHNPLMSTRSGPGAPQAYLATTQAAAFRHIVYNAAGSSVGDRAESHGWGSPTGWVWMGQFVDLDAQTSQLAAVDAASGRRFIGPVRSLTGAPNPASTADLYVFALPGSSMWTGGLTDEVMVAHPSADFDLEEYVERIRCGIWADAARQEAAGSLAVSDLGVTAQADYVFSTGAEHVSWTQRPEPSISGAVPHWSADDGATWQTGELPSTFTGLLRWDVPLKAGDTFTSLRLLPPPPTLEPIPDMEVEQNDTITVPLHSTSTGIVSWRAYARGIDVAVIGGTQLVISTGWASGAIPVTVTISDLSGREASRTFTVDVIPAPWTPPPPGRFPRAPIILRGEDGNDEIITDALSAVIPEEINGEHSLEFSIPVKHRHGGLIRPEGRVEVAGGFYRVRRITTGRKGRAPVLTVFCEADWYDLAYAGQLPPREYLQTPAGVVMQEALEGTGWSIGSVTVTTRRTYSTEETNPLALLRLVAQQHGGDLIFDSQARTVSLVVESGRDVGVSFFYGRDLTESKRVIDTTSLITRIYARNADGATIAPVNGGKPYVENFAYTDEVREATYDFASGVSPFTMLNMASATLAARSKPAYSYEFTVADLSYRSGQDIDRFGVGDTVTVVDDELGIREAQRIIRVEHDLVRPWASRITLSAKLRGRSSSADGGDGPLTSGSGQATFDLVPFNTLKNGRFDNGLAHWAGSGVGIVDGSGTGDYAVRFSGAGVRWIEQTVQPDNRDSYSLSLDVSAVTGGSVPPLTAVVTVEYEDGTTDVIPVELG